jgi:hypothetical protein
MKKICAVYRSPNVDEMYLYIEKSKGLEPVPEALLARFGKPKMVMTLLVHAGQPLARVSVDTLLAALDKQGFYLQMPPLNDGTDEAMKAISLKNSKLSR